MPLLTLDTNLDIDQERCARLLPELSNEAATLLGKPESYVMVKIQAAQTMCFGGSDAACAYLQLKSLGLPEDRTAEFSAQLCQWISKNMDIPADRIYIEFSSPARHLWGWNQGTFG